MTAKKRHADPQQRTLPTRAKARIKPATSKPQPAKTGRPRLARDPNSDFNADRPRPTRDARTDFNVDRPRRDADENVQGRQTGRPPQSG